MHAIFFLLFPAILFSSPVVIKLLTDNTPDWSNVESAAKSMTASLTSDEQKAVALFKWTALMRHQVPPAHDSISDATVPPNHPQYGIIYNPIKLANNYGNTFCVSTNSILPLLWRKLGNRSIEHDIKGHTVCDLEWDSSWHHFDAAFGFIYRDSTSGNILDCKSIIDREKGKVKSMISDFTYCNRLDTAKVNGSIYHGTRIHNILGKTMEYSVLEASRETLFTEMYSDNYRYEIKLKPYESYTKYFHQIADSLKYYLPATALSAQNPNLVGKERLNVVVNGIWRFEPNFYDKLSLSSFSVVKNIDNASGTLKQKKGNDTSFVVYKISAANIICHAEAMLTHTLGKKGSSITLYFSADSTNWYKIAVMESTGKSIKEHISIDGARTRTDYFIKLAIKAEKNDKECGINKFSVNTYTIINPRTIPLLTLGSNRIKLIAADGIAASFFWTEINEDNIGKLIVKPRSYLKNAKSSIEEWFINCDGIRNPTMDSIKLSWKLQTNEVAGYSDKMDVGTLREVAKYYYRFGKNIAVGSPVAASPPTDSMWVLTDNEGGPRQPAAVWQKGANPVVTIELDNNRTIASGVRILQALNDCNDDFFDSCIVQICQDGMSFKREGVITKRQVYESVTNYLHPNTYDKPEFRLCRNMNIKRFKFSHAFDTGKNTVKAVRFEMYNSRSDLRVEEIEIYDFLEKKRVVNEIDHSFTLPDPAGAL